MRDKQKKVLELEFSLISQHKPIKTSLFLCFAELIATLNEEAENIISKSTMRSNKKFVDMIDFIEKNLSVHISTNTLSQKFNMTSSHIGYIFKNEISISPVTYITNHKMTKAARMMLASPKKTKVILEKCGFNSNIYFQRIFKDAFGITLKQFINKFSE